MTNRRLVMLSFLTVMATAAGCAGPRLVVKERVLAAYPSGHHDEHQLRISGDRRHIAYIDVLGNSVVVDGCDRGYRGASTLIGLSNDGKRVAWQTTLSVASETKEAIVVDGVRDPAFDRVAAECWLFCFSEDGKRYAYTAELGGKELAVVDGEAGQPYESVALVWFSPDGKRVAYFTAQGNKLRMVADGVEGPQYDAIAWNGFSQDSRRLGYLAARDDSWRIVVDGTERPIDVEKWAEGLVFSPDGRQVAYVAGKGESRLAVVGDVHGGEYDYVKWLTFSPDGSSVAYAAARNYARDDETWFMVCGNSEGKQYPWVGPPVFSADGRGLAHVARATRKDAADSAPDLLVIDGKEHPGLWGTFIHGPDGWHTAHLVKEGNKYRPVIDGIEMSESYDEILGHHSLWGKSGLVFDSPRHLHFLAVRDGTIVLVEVRIVR